MDVLLNIDAAELILLLTAPWLLLVLFSTFVDAVVGFVDEWLLKELKEKRRDEETIDAPGRLILISGLFGIVVAALASVYVAVSAEYVFQASFVSYSQAFLAGMLEVIWLIPYFYALDRGGALNTTPLFQTVPIFSLVFGFLFFNEFPVLHQLAAVALILVGAYVLNYSKTAQKADSKTLGLMFISSAVISLGFFLFKDSAQNGSFVTTLIGNGFGMFCISALIYLIWTPYRQQFNWWLSSVQARVLLGQAGNESLYSLSAVTNQLALIIGPSVVVVSSFNAFHPVFTLIIALGLARLGSKTHQNTLTKENTYYKVCGIVLISVGALCIALI